MRSSTPRFPIGYSRKGISYEKISADINMNEDGSISINEIGYCGREFEKASAAIKSNIADTEVKQIE